MKSKQTEKLKEFLKKVQGSCGKIRVCRVTGNNTLKFLQKSAVFKEHCFQYMNNKQQPKQNS